MTSENRAQTELQTLTKQLNALYELICAQKRHAQTEITLQDVVTIHNLIPKLRHIATISPDVREEDL